MNNLKAKKWKIPASEKSRPPQKLGNIRIIWQIILVLALTTSACGDQNAAGEVSTPSMPAASKAASSPTADSPSTSTPEPLFTATLMTEEAAVSTEPTPITLPTLGVFPTLFPAAQTTAQPGGACPPGSANQPELKAIPISGNSSPAKMYEEVILDYLNSGGDLPDLKESISGLRIELDDETWKAHADLFQADITGNSVDEVILNLVFSAEESASLQFTVGWLGVFSCGNERYQVIHDQDTSAVIGSPEDGIRGVLDMNRDGRAEIVLSAIDNCGTHANCTRKFFVLGWDGNQMQNLAYGVSIYSGSPEPGIYVYNGDGIIEDRDQDDYYELYLSNGLAHYYETHNMERPRTDIYRWNGEIFTLAGWEHPAPVYRIQAVWDGDDAMLFGENEKALAFYQQAIFDEELESWSLPPTAAERQNLAAYARYRIMLIHHLNGNSPEAQIVIDSLQEKFPPGIPGSQYANLAGIFREGYLESGDLKSSCQRVVDVVASNTEKFLNPLGAAYNLNSYQPQDVCPFY